MSILLICTKFEVKTHVFCACFSVRTRLESEEGLSLTEFTYQVFQACDWLHLYEKYNCTVQVCKTLWV